MASNIVLPSLTNWAKSRISAIVEATKPADLATALGAFLAENATITVNGKHLSRNEYMASLQGEKFEEAGASVAFSGEVEVPRDSANTIEAGSVGLFYTAIISEAIVIHDSPVQHQVTSSINLVIEVDQSIQKPNLPGRGGAFDPRRVVALNQVLIDRAVTRS